MRAARIIGAAVAMSGLLTTASSATSPNYTFTTIDAPGASGEGTVANGINNNAEIVGYFPDNTGAIHGFIYTNGVFSQIDVPGAAFTEAFDINNIGQIVGAFFPETPGPLTASSSALAASSSSTCPARSTPTPKASTTVGRSSVTSLAAELTTASFIVMVSSIKSTCPAQSKRKLGASTTVDRSSENFLMTTSFSTASYTAAEASRFSTCPARGLLRCIGLTKQNRSSAVFSRRHLTVLSI